MWQQKDKLLGHSWIVTCAIIEIRTEKKNQKNLNFDFVFSCGKY